MHFTESLPYQSQELPPSSGARCPGRAAKAPQAPRRAAEIQQDEQDPAPALHALQQVQQAWGTHAPHHYCQSHGKPTPGALPAEGCISPDNGILKEILVFIA